MRYAICLFVLGFLSIYNLNAQTINFSVERGFYANPITVVLSTDLPNATIKYTLDYTDPTVNNGSIYSSSLSIAQTTSIRALAYNSTDTVQSITHTYTFLADIIAQDTMKTHITQDPVWGPQLVDAFLDIPSVFISTEYEIIDSPLVAVSAEFIFPDTGDHFQANCGAKIYGNGGYHTDRLSIRLHFDEKWNGPKNLEYPFFEGFEEGIEPIKKFDKIDLRHGWYNTWDNKLHDIRFTDYKRYNYISTKIGDDIMLQMGHLSPHTRFAHVFQNGVYNGIITLRERFDDNLIAEYHGEDNAAYEYLATPNQRVSVFHPYSPDLKDGSGVYWADLVNRSTISYSSWKELIDEDNFFDRMVAFIYGQGEAEYRAVAAPQLGYEFILNLNDADMFFYLGSPVHSDRTNPYHNLNGPDNMFVNLFDSGDPDFRMDFADRAHLHLTGDGVLTHNKIFPHYQSIADIIDKAIIAESARWSKAPDENRDTWRNTIDNTGNTYTSIRPQIVIDDLKNSRLYPTLDAVQYSVPEGLVANGTAVTLSNPNNNGTIYYSTNGVDPRASGGAITGTAYTGPITITNAVTKIEARVLGTDITYNETNHAIGKPSQMSSNISATDYQAYNANDGILFGVLAERTMTRPTNEFQPWWEVDLQSSETIHKVKVWYTSELGSYYLNRNIHIFVSNNPIPDVDAAVLQADPAIESFFLSGFGGDVIEFDLPANYQGQYVRVMMDETTQTLWLSEVEVIEYDYANPVTNQVWSAMKPMIYYLPQSYSDVVINEIHYHPTDSIIVNDTIKSKEYEFVELKNTGASTIDLSGVEIINGVRYTFPFGTTLAPGQFFVIAEDSLNFIARYGLSPDAVFSGKLSNNSDVLQVLDPLGNLIDEVIYSDLIPWETSPDGTGPSLALLPTATDNSLATSWKEQVVRYTPKAENDFCLPIAATNFLIDATCNGDSNGSIVFLPSGGTAPYNYSWSNGSTQQNLTNIGSGTYTVNVTDLYNCPYTESFNISEPAALISTSSSTNLKCFNDNSGNASVTASGGTSPYTYSWSNGQGAASISNLSAGTYTVTVEDNNSCQKIESVTITEPPALALSSFWVDETVAGANDGVINLAVNGGTAPYTYSWSHGPNYQDVNSLAAGTYTVNVTDLNGCTETHTTTIQPGVTPCAIPANIVASNIQNTSATLSWDANPNVNNFEVEYREQGVPNWNVFNSNFSFAILNNLLLCTTYEVRIKANCASAQVSTYSNIYTFQTAGCVLPCAPIIGLFSQNVTTSSAFLVWDIVPNATYTMYYRAVGNTTWFSYPTQFPIAILFTLPSCTDFEWYVEVNCPTGQISTPSPIANFTTIGAACKLNNNSNYNIEKSINEVNVFPNPTQGISHVSFFSDNEMDVYISLYDLTGKILFSNDVYAIKGENLTSISLTDFPNGIYHLQISSEEMIISKKIIKQ